MREKEEESLQFFRELILIICFFLYRDYLTEKVFNVLQYRILPVVRGGANYSALLPPHSFIDASRMRPRELAQLLHRLTEHEDEYEAYFQWRDHFEVTQVKGEEALECQLCERMQQRQKNEGSAEKKKSSSSGSSLPSPVTAEKINWWYFNDENGCSSKQ